MQKEHKTIFSKQIFARTWRIYSGRKPNLHLYEFATDSISLCHLQVQVKSSSLLVGYQFLYFRHLTITPEELGENGQ